MGMTPWGAPPAPHPVLQFQSQPPTPPTVITMIKSIAIRFVSPSTLAEVIIANPTAIGPNRAGALFKLATDGVTPSRRSLGRRALQAAAKAASRDVSLKADGTPINNRVFSKASNARLRNWAQDRNTLV